MQRILLILATLAVLCLTGWLLRPWANYLAELAQRTAGVDIKVDSTTKEAAEHIRDGVARRFGRAVKLIVVSDFAVKDWTPQTSADQLQIIANHGTPDLGTYVPVASGESISDAYGILLRELLVEASEGADADAELRIVLGRFVSQKKRPANSSKTSLALLSHTIETVLRSRLGDKARVVQLAEALNAYESDAEHTSRISITPPSTSDNAFEARAVKTGVFVLTGFSQGKSDHFSFSGTVFGPSYEFYNLSRPSWFDFEILEYAKQQRTTSSRLDEFFGTAGYLSRIPVGLIIVHPQRLQIETRDYAHVKQLSEQSTSLYLEGSGVRLAVPAGHVVTQDNGVVSFDTIVGAPEIVAVISEEI
jgi:hypothetical protein